MKILKTKIKMIVSVVFFTSALVCLHSIKIISCHFQQSWAKLSTVVSISGLKNLSIFFSQTLSKFSTLYIGKWYFIGIKKVTEIIGAELISVFFSSPPNCRCRVSIQWIIWNNLVLIVSWKVSFGCLFSVFFLFFTEFSWKFPLFRANKWEDKCEIWSILL